MDGRRTTTHVRGLRATEDAAASVPARARTSREEMWRFFVNIPMRAPNS
jgi:hypothetical protein